MTGRGWRGSGALTVRRRACPQPSRSGGPGVTPDVRRWGAGEAAADGSGPRPGVCRPLPGARPRAGQRHSSGTRFLCETRHTVFGLPVPRKTSAENCGVAQSEGFFLCDLFVMGFGRIRPLWGCKVWVRKSEVLHGPVPAPPPSGGRDRALLFPLAVSFLCAPAIPHPILVRALCSHDFPHGRPVARVSRAV